MMLFLLITLSLFTILTLVVVFRQNHTVPLQTTREKYQLKDSNYFNFHGLSCHYTDEGQGEVILMVHGLGDSFKMFSPIVNSLSASYRVIRVDLPGFGLSDVPANFQPQGSPVEYYEAFMKHFVELLKIKQFHLMGNSLGGLVSWEFAVDNQPYIKSLCLISSAGYEMDAVKHNISKGVLHLIPNFLLRRGMPYSFAEKNVAMVIKQREFRTKSFIDVHYDMLNADGTIAYLIKLLNFNSIPDTKRLNSLKIPTFIVWGENDKITPFSHAAKFAADIPNSQTKIYPTCGHYPQVEYSNLFIDDWLNFVKNKL